MYMSSLIDKIIEEENSRKVDKEDNESDDEWCKWNI
jgi:hypothetical protein